MKFWRDHYCPHRIDLRGEVGSLNVLATKSEDRKIVCIKAVTPTEQDVNVEVDLPGRTINGASMQLVAPGSLGARNTLNSSDTVRPESAKVVVKERAVSFEMPAYSAGAVTVSSALLEGDHHAAPASSTPPAEPRIAAQAARPQPFLSQGNPILDDGSYYSADGTSLSSDGKLAIYFGNDRADR